MHTRLPRFRFLAAMPAKSEALAKAKSFRMAVGYFCASARIKFDDEQFAALFNELQVRGDKGKLRQLFGS
jgi:hypothetical protein